MNYQRVVQWLAGPFAAVIGVLATKAVAHLSFLGSAGLQQSAVAHGIVTGSVFISTALVTYASHQKWMTNLAKWWETSGITAPAAPTVDDVPPPATDVSGFSSLVIKAAPQTPADKLRAQLTAAGIKPDA